MPLSQDGESDFSLYDTVQSSNIPSPDSGSMQESVSTNITRALNKLTKRESAILTMSFGLCGTPCYTLHDIALMFNMSSERIRQIRSRGLLKLKIMLKGKYAFLES
jgi:RNA polymerase primary sigma factor